MAVRRGEYGYYIDRRLPVIGRLNKTLETKDKETAIYRESVILRLADRGEFDLLRKLDEGVFGVATLIDAVEQGKQLDLIRYRGNPLVRDLIDQFSDEKGREIKTVDRYVRSLHGFVRWRPTLKIGDVSSFVIERYKRDLLTMGRKNSGINRDLIAIRQLLVWFGGKSYAREIFDEVTMLPPSPRRTRRLEPKEIEALLSVASPRYKPFFVAMLETGLRPSEVCRIKWEDVDVINLTLRVRDSKTAAGERLVPISPKLVTLLQNNRSPMNPSELSMMFSRFAWRARLRDVQLRDLRRTHLQYCRLADGDIVKQRDQAGHTTVRHTEAYLGESRVEERRAMVEAAVEAMGVYGTHG